MLKKFTTLLLVFTLGVSQFAQAALEIVITEGVDSARPIAIVPFKYNGTGEMPSSLSDVISADLMRSGKFKPVAEADMPQLPTTDSEIDYAAWVDAGVEAVVVGTVTQQSAGRYLVKYELIDVIRAQLTGGETRIMSNGRLMQSDDHVLEGRQSIVSSTGFRNYAHQISDVVYEALTGERGRTTSRNTSSG